jgi:hypothetical protein
MNGSPSPSTRLLQAVAVVDDCPPAELDPLLYDVVDPDALDRLFTRSTTPIQIEFDYAGHNIQMTSRRVFVDNREFSLEQESPRSEVAQNRSRS